MQVQVRLVWIKVQVIVVYADMIQYNNTIRWINVRSKADEMASLILHTAQKRQK